MNLIKRISNYLKRKWYQVQLFVTKSDLKILVLGDSHCEVFQYINKSNLRSKYRFQVVNVNGATARGLLNPNSKTNSVNVFKNAIKNINSFALYKPKSILIQLGEVDCGYLIWYRAKKYQESVEKQLSDSLSAYQSFVLWLLDNSQSQIIISSTLPPTIRDNEAIGKVAQARNEVKTSQIDRTKLTLEYNQQMEAFCQKYPRLQYLDVTSKFISPTTGLVDDRYRNENESDHHLSSAKTAPVWIDKILTLINN